MNDSQDYNYNTAGLDGFLSRSIDNLAQMTLDSQGPVSTQTRFDVGQISGGIGDSFKIGGISLAGKTNEITLNDGMLTVNDRSTGTSVQANSGNLNYRDSNNNLVVQEGVLDNGATGIRIVDKSGVGLAQFGRNIDGTTSLKIADAGIEVNTATNDQLIFNSNQDIFKIVKKDTSLSLNVVTPGAYYGQTSVAHNLPYIPSFQATMVFSNALQALGSFTSSTNHYNPALLYGTIGSAIALFAIAEVSVDATNIYLTLQLAPSISNNTYSVSATVYLQQETFS